MNHQTYSRRRGNAIVLAASILVLLVIIATTFVSRTQTARRTASAVQRDAAAETSFDSISESIASVVSEALFVRLIDAHYDPFLTDETDTTFAAPRSSWSTDSLATESPTGAPLVNQFVPQVRGVVSPLPSEIESGDGTGPPLLRLAVPSINQGLREVSDSNRSRILARDARPGTVFGDLLLRFNLDNSASWYYPSRQDFVLAYDSDPLNALSNLKLGRAPSWLKRYGVDPRFPANFAPYEVVPWTNWPDREGYPWSPSNGGTGLRGFDSSTWTPLFSQPDASIPFAGIYQSQPGPTGQQVSVFPRFSDNAWNAPAPGNGSSSNLSVVGVGEGNPLFGPGFGDTRWLRDLEPMSVDAFGAEDSGPLVRQRDGIPDSFRQWRHLSNISTAENNWRVVLDISDVTGVRRTAQDGYNPEDPDNSRWPSLPVVSDLSIPIEQWLANIPYGEIYDFNPSIDASQRIGPSGSPRLFPSDFVRSGDLLNPSPLELSWAQWANRNFHPRRLTLVDEISPPLNFYNLYDLNANGRRSEPGERLSDRFVGVRKSVDPLSWAGVPDNPTFPNGTPAWNISRFLDDADGDGFTDSFWYLPTSSPKNGILQVVSVSVTDNAGRLDLSSGSRFSPGLQEVPNDGPAGSVQLRDQVRERGTRGATPGDLALVSLINADITGPDHPLTPSGNREPIAEAKVGFFDIPEHGELWRQIPGLLTEPGFTDLSWPVSPALGQPFNPFAATTAAGPLVRQDYSGFHNYDGQGNQLGSWGNFLNVSGWRLWFFEEFGRQPTLDEERQAFLTHKERLSIWRDGIGVDNARRLSLASELELRLIEGHNSSDIFSDAEYMLGSWRHKPYDNDFGGAHPLRSVSVATEEAQSFGGLMNGELRADLRHRVTTYSMTRNDLLPDWLRWKWDLVYDFDGDDFLETPNIPSPGLEYNQGSLALLIGQDGTPFPLGGVDPDDPNFPTVWNSPDVDDPSETWSLAYQTLLEQFDQKVDLREANPSRLLGTHFTSQGYPTGRALLSRRLSYLIMNALADGDENGAWFGSWGGSGGSYFGMTRDVLIPEFDPVELSSRLIPDQNFAYVEEKTYKDQSGDIDGYFADGQSNSDSRTQSRAIERWLQLVSAGLAANILSYRDNDWEPVNPDNPLSRLVPRFRDIAPLYSDEFPNNPLATQQSGLTPLPGWDRSSVRDADERLVSIQTGQPLRNQSPDQPGAVPIEGMLGLEVQPFLTEAAVVFLHSATKNGTDFDGYSLIDPAQAPFPNVPSYMASQKGLPYVTAESDHRAVVAVQIANPFDRPIPPEELAKYRLSVCGMHAPLASCWIDTPDFFPPEPNELSDSLSPLEPVTQDRNASAIFWLDPSAVNYPNAPSWSPADDVDAQLFKDNLMRWMGITTQQDDLPNVAGEFAIDGSWGSTGTIRYNVPLRDLSSPGPAAQGWVNRRSAYQRPDLNFRNDTPVELVDVEAGVLSGIDFDFASGQRSVELSRIDHGASLAAEPSLDAVNNNTGDDVPDGLVDIANMQSPFCVWVVVDRFDLGEGLDSTSDRFLSGTDDDQFRQETTPEVGTTPGRQTTDFPRDWPSNEFARLLNPFLPVSNSQESPETTPNPGNYEAPLSLFLIQNPPGLPPSSSGGPIVKDSTVTRRFPSVVDQNGVDLTLPDVVPDTSVPGNTRRFAYVPGIFPPLNIVLNGDNPIDFIENDETSASQYVPVNFSQANTFVQAFGVRRGWTIDSNATISNPSSFGVDPSEFSLQFLSATQEVTRLATECRVFPKVFSWDDLYDTGYVERATNTSLSGTPGNPWEDAAGNPIFVPRDRAVSPGSNSTDPSVDPTKFLMNVHDPRLKVAGSFIDVSNTTLTTPQPGVSPINFANDRWGGPVRFGIIDSQSDYPSGFIRDLTFTDGQNRLSLQDFVLTPFAFDGERDAHFFARELQGDQAYPFVFSKTMPRLHGFPNSVNLGDYSPGLVLNHKDDDFDQIGEVLNIPLVGHHLRLVPLQSSTNVPGNALPFGAPGGRSIPTVETVRTFSEFLSGKDLDFNLNQDAVENIVKRNPTRQHLLLDTPAAGKLGLGRISGVPEPLSYGPGTRTAPDFADPRHAQPDLPAALRLLDLFTCDGSGFNHDGIDGNYFRETDPDGDRFDLARGFTSRGTRGLLNINTASVESLRALPNWYKALGVDAYTGAYSSVGAERFPRTWMAEAAASYRDGISNLTATHGMPLSRTFFDLRDTIHTVQVSTPGQDVQSILPASDFPVHAQSYKQGHAALLSPNLSRYPDPSLPELHPFELNRDGLASTAAAQPARSNSPRGFKALGEIRQVDHRSRPSQLRLIQRVRPDVGLNGAPDFPPGWDTVFGSPNTYTQIQGTAADLQFDSESFSVFSMAGTNAGSGPFWPFRQKTRRSMARQNIVVGNAWDDSNGRGLGFTNFEQIGVGDQGSYISPYQRSDHVIDIETMPFQRSLTSPLDVAGNWNSTVVATAQGGVELFQDPAGGDLEDANLLLAGAANLLTTRSDTFVAHFRVRSFRQNAETGVWDATDPNYIVDERRFVMLVDRSAVNTPNDRPDVLFLEEAPK